MIFKRGKVLIDRKLWEQTLRSLKHSERVFHTEFRVDVLIPEHQNEIRTIWKCSLHDLYIHGDIAYAGHTSDWIMGPIQITIQPPRKPLSETMTS